MRKKLINTASHQLIWWTSVLGVIFGFPFVGFWVMLPVLALHLLFMAITKREIYLILFAAIIGTILDTLLNIFDIVSYKGTFSFAEWLAPIWITAMWVGFSLTVNHSLKWLSNRKFLGFIIGMIFGPMAYFAGQRYGAVQLATPSYIPLIILSLMWGLTIPLLYIVSDNIKIGDKNEV